MFPYINIKSCFFLGFSLLIFRNDFTQNPQRRLKKVAQPGEKAKLDSNALFEMVFGLTTKRDKDPLPIPPP